MLVTKLRHLTRGGREGFSRVSTSSFTTLTLQPGSRQQQKAHALSIGGVHYRRNYVAVRKSKPAPKSIAVLGGGLTGLSTAYYITRHLPNAKVTIYEATDRLGGWIDTETVNVMTPDGIQGQVRFERGARSVKAPRRVAGYDLDGLLFIDLLEDLKLSREVQSADRETHVGKYVYYPDHLVPLGLPPSSLFFKRPLSYLNHVAQLIQNLKDEPTFKGVVSSLINFYRTKTPPEKEADVSVGHYLEHRFGRRSLVDNVMSAMIHGIYGGDVWKLSLDSSPLRWRKRAVHLAAENRGLGEQVMPIADLELLSSLTQDRRAVIRFWAEGWLPGQGEEATSASSDPEWFWFKKGFSTLTDALATNLRKNPNVTIKMGEPVSSLVYHATDAVALRVTMDKKTVLYDKVISTMFAGNLSSLIKPGLVPTLDESKAVTIQLVNLWYPTPRLNHPAHGFGYLIPQSVPYEQNPECALGVIFDSDREVGWDFDDSSTPNKPRTTDTVPGTKFTVMLGGHYWDELPKEMWPSGEEAVEMAKRVLARHLNIPQEETDRAVGSTKLCRQCIPQHFVGHTRRMNNLEGELQSAFRGRLAVIGGSYQLPGVLPSIRAAYDISKQLAREYDPKYVSAWHTWQPELEPLVNKVDSTGLGRVAKQMQFLTLPPEAKVLLPKEYSAHVQRTQ